MKYFLCSTMMYSYHVAVVMKPHSHMYRLLT